VMPKPEIETRTSDPKSGVLSIKPLSHLNTMSWIPQRYMHGLHSICMELRSACDFESVTVIRRTLY